MSCVKWQAASVEGVKCQVPMVFGADEFPEFGNAIAEEEFRHGLLLAGISI